MHPVLQIARTGRGKLSEEHIFLLFSTASFLFSPLCDVFWLLDGGLGYLVGRLFFPFLGQADKFVCVSQQPWLFSGGDLVFYSGRDKLGRQVAKAQVQLIA